MELVSLEISRPCPSGYAGGPDLWYEDLEMTFEQFENLCELVERNVDYFLKRNKISCDKN